MAINWRQRAPILRVLAAVYAELGEEAFKGRYGRIAKLYGTEATYDAIKSFFAKEVVKMAEDLKFRNLGSGEDANRGLHRHRSNTLQRPLHLSFDDDDDDVMIMGEREVRDVAESSQPTRPVAQSKIRHESVDDGYDFDRPIHSTNGFRAVNVGHQPSVTPGPSSRPARQKQNSPETQAQSRKRPHAVLDASDELPPSFGYVTERGQHRCALCMTELPNGEILRKHELASKLHLTNLKDPMMISKGCITLAEVASLAESAPRPQHRPNSASLRVSGFDGRAGSTVRQQLDRRRQPSISYGRSISIVSDEAREETLDMTTVALPHNDPNHQQNHKIATNGNMESHCSDSGPPPDIEGFQHQTIDKGKGRAQTVPRGLAAATGALSDMGREISGQKGALAAASLKPPAGEIAPEDIQPTLLAQLLLSSGMELLAKKCIEEHPELQMGFYKCIQEMQGRDGLKGMDGRKRVREGAVE